MGRLRFSLRALLAVQLLVALVQEAEAAGPRSRWHYGERRYNAEDAPPIRQYVAIRLRSVYRTITAYRDVCDNT